MHTALALVKTLRLHQWTKNLLIFAAIIFSHNLTDSDKLLKVVLAFLAFSFLSSSVYILNDLLDRKRDQLHPTKRYRPIASGRLKPGIAALGGVVLLVVAALFGLGVGMGFLFMSVLISYFVLNLAYSTVLKKMVVADVIAIALGFLLRVTAGGLAIDVEVSRWLIMCTFFAATMLACCKRRSEMVHLGDSSEVRAVLADYTLPLLDIFISITACASLITYALYTVSDRTYAVLKTNDLIYTLPVVLYGICRYLFLVYRRNEGEDPALVLLKDVGMIIAIVVWIGLAFVIIYHSNTFGNYVK